MGFLWGGLQVVYHRDSGETLRDPCGHAHGVYVLFNASTSRQHELLQSASVLKQSRSYMSVGQRRHFAVLFAV